MKRIISVLAFAAIIAHTGLCAVKQAERGIVEYHTILEDVR